MLNHEFEGLSKTGRAREVPLTILSNWIASRLFTKPTAGRTQKYAPQKPMHRHRASRSRRVSGVSPVVRIEEIVVFGGFIHMTGSISVRSCFWEMSESTEAVKPSLAVQ